MSARASLVLALAVLCPPVALAAPAGGDIDLQAFHPALDSRGFITVNASQVLGPGELSFGLVTAWGKDVLRFAQGANRYEVQNLITPTLVAALGLRPFGLELELGASLPFAIMSGDRSPDFDNGTPANPNDDLNYRFQGQGLGDAGLHAKWRLRSTSRRPGLGVALIASVYLPTAPRGAWLGDAATSPELLAVIDAEPGRFKLGLSAGLRLRPHAATFRDDQPRTAAGQPLPMTGGVITAGSSLPVGLAASYAVVPQSFEAVAEVFGAIPLAGTDYFPLEAVAGLKLYLAQSSFLSFGAGAGLLDRGGSPRLRGFLGIVFEPSVGDRDHDGIKDDVDQCPDDPEDRDDFEDEDGCPDPDNDRDRIPDVDDACPNEPEDRDGFEDEDGCPEANAVDRDGDKIPDDLDQCPDDPEDYDGFEDKDGCPDPDNDGDKILDVDDLCPNEPEDYDGFEDRDGCPEPDNDRDRIPDKDDACPRKDGETREQTAETWNGVDDQDGCPDRSTVIRTATTLDILDKVYFEFDSAVIQQRSYAILEAVATTLALNPDLLRVEVQGHTDERGDAAYNLDLSQRRAEAVVDFLVDHGVARARLTAQGYGESQPLDRHHREAAWAQNRRVQFIILEQAPQPD